MKTGFLCLAIVYSVIFTDHASAQNGAGGGEPPKLEWRELPDCSPSLQIYGRPSQMKGLIEATRNLVDPAKTTPPQTIANDVAYFRTALMLKPGAEMMRDFAQHALLGVVMSNGGWLKGRLPTNPECGVRKSLQPKIAYIELPASQLNRFEADTRREGYQLRSYRGDDARSVVAIVFNDFVAEDRFSDLQYRLLRGDFGEVNFGVGVKLTPLKPTDNR